MQQVNNLSTEHSLISNWVSELRDVEVQPDRMRFRRNLERSAEATTRFGNYFKSWPCYAQWLA